MGGENNKQSCPEKPACTGHPFWQSSPLRRSLSDWEPWEPETSCSPEANDRHYPPWTLSCGVCLRNYAEQRPKVRIHRVDMWWENGYISRRFIGLQNPQRYYKGHSKTLLWLWQASQPVIDGVQEVGYSEEVWGNGLWRKPFNRDFKYIISLHCNHIQLWSSLECVFTFIQWIFSYLRAPHLVYTSLGDLWQPYPTPSLKFLCI